MRVGLVRNVGLSVVALFALLVAGCDDTVLTFEDGTVVLITTNPSTMTIQAGVTTLLESRAVDGGNRPTFDEVEWTVDATCGDATVGVEVAADFEPTVHPPGRFDVTGGTTIGTTCIELTSGGVTASVDVTVVGDNLEITGAPAGPVVVLSTVQLGVALLADGGSPVAPFDPLTDITWSSSDASIASVDATGLVTAAGAGVANITATWTDAGVTVASSVAIAVEVPVPVLTSADVGAAAAGDLVTLTGTGFIAGPHAIFLDGFEITSDPLFAAMIVNGTTASFRMPPGAPGDVDVQVGSLVAGLSAAVVVTRTDDDDEPANNSPLTSNQVIASLPFSVHAFFDGGADADDFYLFSPIVPTTIQVDISWVGASGDLDVLFTDAGFTMYAGGFGCATAPPQSSESCQETFIPGDYAIWVNDFEHPAGFTEYDLDIVSVP